MLSNPSDMPDDERGFFAKILDFAPGLVIKLRGVFMTMQNPESIDHVIAAARQRGYFDDGGDMFLFLAHRFQSMTEEVKKPQNTFSLEALSDHTLRVLGTYREEVQSWMELGIIRTLLKALEFARNTASDTGDKTIAGRPRGFLEGDEEIFLGELQRLGYETTTLENADSVIMEKLGTSQTELLFLRKIGKLHRAAWLIKQAREDGYLWPDTWEGLMTYLSDAEGIPDTLRLEHISDETLTLSGLNRTEVQGWFRHVPE